MTLWDIFIELWPRVRRAAAGWALPLVWPYRVTGGAAAAHGWNERSEGSQAALGTLFGQARPARGAMRRASRSGCFVRAPDLGAFYLVQERYTAGT